MPSQAKFPLENTLEDWRKLKFKHPKNKIRLATIFSGIGAIEHALERLKLKHQIVFAGDIDPQRSPVNLRSTRKSNHGRR